MTPTPAEPSPSSRTRPRVPSRSPAPCASGSSRLAHMPSTTGVILRAPAADDLDVLYALASELDTWEERGPQPPRAITREEFAARFDKVLTEPSQEALFVIEADGAAVGRCALFDIDHLARTAEVGIAIHAPARGRGYGTEALRALVAFAFERCNLRRAHLRVIASNVAAIA